MDASGAPEWTVTDRGHTTMGWPWLVIRARGGRTMRITVHGARATEAEVLDAIEIAVSSASDHPGRTVH